MTDPSPPTILERITTYDRIPTDLDGAELQRIIDTWSAEVVKRHGPHANPVTPIIVTMPGGTPTVMLERPIDEDETIVVVEARRGSTVEAVTETTLATDDYRIWYGGRTLERLQGGTHPGSYWGRVRGLGAPFGYVTITYTPQNDGNQREEVILKLVKLTLDYETASRIGFGDVSLTQVDYHAECEALLESLRSPGALFR